MITLGIEDPGIEIKSVLDGIRELERKNKIKLDIQIFLDFSMESNGEYIIGTNKILINPFKCKEIQNTSKTIFPRYTSDFSTFGVLWHEVAHFLSLKYFKNYVKKYKHFFATKRLMISNYEASNSDIEEEMAEILNLYLTNPYLLKLISEDHFRFNKQFLLSPTSCTPRKFIEFFMLFPSEIKKKIEKNYKITVDIEKNKVYKNQ